MNWEIIQWVLQEGFIWDFRGNSMENRKDLKRNFMRFLRDVIGRNSNNNRNVLVFSNTKDEGISPDINGC